MGIYIPNMKMPEHCGECRFAVDGWCYAYGKPNLDALANDGRTNFCPLIPVPKHGRLIDGDELADGCDAPHWCRWLSEIEDAPTIIPPSKEGE